MGVAAGAGATDETATSLADGDGVWAAGSWVAAALGVVAGPAELSGLAAEAVAAAGVTSAAVGALLACELGV